MQVKAGYNLFINNYVDTMRRQLIKFPTFPGDFPLPEPHTGSRPE